MKLDPKNNSQTLPGYDTFWILLSDTSKMKVAICQDCKKSLDTKKSEAVITAHQEFWKKGIEKSIDAKIAELQKTKEEQINYYNNLTSVKFSLRERDLE